MSVDSLKEVAKKVRMDIVNMIYNAKSGHPGGSLSCTDILVALYHEKMNLNLDENGNRIDKFVLSKGHAAPAYYAVLSSKGFIPHEDLKTLRKIDSYLEGHPSNKINGVDVSSGSLGQGLSIANGMALAKKLDNIEGKVYCVLGDGEIQEGQIWEACMTANKYKLNNLVTFLDYNGLQIDGNIMDVKSVNNLKEKFESFGWNVQEIDGHDFEQILVAIDNTENSLKPNMIIAKTIKGKGVSFMENKAGWHGKAPNEEEYKLAIEELSK
ncbi:MAG: transketolase [Clostridia bacterium]|nr:transketolase [Clostridia bacterium]